jgi:hypothetical protein
MAAPTPTARQTPAGRKLKDGFKATITFKRFPAIRLWEKSVTPPGWDGGDAIDTTTMHNSDLRTMYPRSLVTLTEASGTVAYDPKAYDEIRQAINVNDEITITYSDGSTLAFWGWLRTFEPSELQEGEFPEAEITITPSNVDDDDAEQFPVMTEIAGT